MKRMAVALAVTLLFGLVAGSALAQGPAKVAGKWEYSTQGPQGPITQEMTVEQDGEKIKVTLKSQRGERSGEGTVKGNDISFTMKFQGRDGTERSFEYKGKVDGDNIKGTIEMGGGGGGGPQGGGPREWSAKRVKE
jgi:hypothetical protein